MFVAIYRGRSGRTESSKMVTAERFGREWAILFYKHPFWGFVKSEPSQKLKRGV
jgi:hypothetical protein